MPTPQGFCLRKESGWSSLFNQALSTLLGTSTKNPINTVGGVTEQGREAKIWVGELIII